ncbi:hypothetical protein PMW_215 [Pseudomonas phage phiPMW]|uniref:Uncharacterized protein n=1 Tax=Pseudomonas phage phiPMW TaxID=1815582 RepID=A0A1S5R1P4_9CAUD|nr:hypothetical protein FDG97_gp135 [Pseudomonas phage phiPMW]ANA49340.1 hypothetical protein PMW_215 [Pseudomonas phage phiPMW]
MAKKFTYKTDRPARDENAPQVDFAGLTKYVVETVGASEAPEGMIGIVSGVIELGKQKQEDAKMKWNGTPEQEAAEIAKNPNQYFQDIKDEKTGAMQRFKRWPVPDAEECAITIDFPGTLLNRGQFYGDENAEALPLRGLLNNEWRTEIDGKTYKTVGRPFGLKATKDKDTGKWSIASNSTLFKLAQATGQLKDGTFQKDQLGDLIGEAVLVEVHVYSTKSGDKEFLNEKFKLMGAVPKIMQAAIPELDEKFMYLVNFNGEQDLDAVKNLRQSVINTMRMASNFEGSAVHKALIETGRLKEGDGALVPQHDGKAQPLKGVEQKAEPKSVPKTEAAEPQEPMDFDQFDEDIPF